jgi:hypothetical protein
MMPLAQFPSASVTVVVSVPPYETIVAGTATPRENEPSLCESGVARDTAPSTVFPVPSITSVAFALSLLFGSSPVPAKS